MSKRILAVLFAALSFNGTALLAQEGSLATIHVYKIHQGLVEADDPSILDVNIQLSCTGGDDLVQNGILQADGTVAFNVNNFQAGVTDCEVTEISGHPDFFPVYLNAGSGNNPPGSGDEWAILEIFEDYPFDEYEQSCVFENIEPGAYTCQVYNVPHTADFAVNKTWEFGASGDTGGVIPAYYIGLACLGGWQVYTDAPGGPDEIINIPYSILPVSFAVWESDSTDDETYETEVVPFLNIYSDDIEGIGSICVPFEDTIDSRVEITSDCRLVSGLGDLNDLFSATISNGQFVLPNTSHECNVVNTVFFEGIPTLNQYGMALMALLMLGLGFVGMRRFA